MNTQVRFRQEQAAIIDGYQGGRLGISAVPGSGKTFTLSHLAARLVESLAAQGALEGIERQEVLIVTFTNSAVNSFRSRIAGILQRERGLLPYIGYRVRTLHGLAHDIVRDRPALVGLAEDFQIIDERIAEQRIADLSRSLLGQYESVFRGYLVTDISEQSQRWVDREKLPELAARLALDFIKNAKNRLGDPDTLSTALQAYRGELGLADFCIAVYRDYQRSLSYRGAVDFDDLVRLAILSLNEDTQYLRRLQDRWPYILEDEAQDSSWLQETMLRLLSGERNWVRVGDPNQAINTTFTTADPRFLQMFLAEPGVVASELHISGRSTLPIIDLANQLVTWAVHDHPVPALRSAFREQMIMPAPPGDPRPNPSGNAESVYIHAKPGVNVTPEQELTLVARSLERFRRENSDSTVAVLSPENHHAYRLAEILSERGIDHEELLRSTTATRAAALRLWHVLNFLANPLNAKALAMLCGEVWTLFASDDLAEDDSVIENVARVLMGCREVEQFIWPLSADWLAAVDAFSEMPEILEVLDAFRRKVAIWLNATILPVDQLILTLTQDLFFEPADIALGHKIAVLMRGFAQNNPGWRLPDFLSELRAISENERKFVGFDDVEQGYEPQPGRVTVATMHAAKGLEWDRVYLLGVSNYGFPSAQPYDNFLAEYWFVRDKLNLQAEALAQLAVLQRPDYRYVEGGASDQARLDYAAERLRLLYVGITRARRSLSITWNMGRFWSRSEDSRNSPALPLVALREYVGE